jgi:hypothetical protein
MPPRGRVAALNAEVLTNAARNRYEAASKRSATLVQSTVFHHASM